ncbi:hypothetical protein RHSIM_RhsimUnG0008900 [Rhododendron simsii]|uniref:Uncharacterized protein n=1 Tax=Rhododendron simsii TaxID=118357 RepID=A0A834L591_RHOSS|nr:hypothetical protein RHSIM_RhsimUnG0008900 [Rhododendron simsii]
MGKSSPFVLGSEREREGGGFSSRKQGKNEADDEKRELVFKEDCQEYAQVLRACSEKVGVRPRASTARSVYATQNWPRDKPHKPPDLGNPLPGAPPKKKPRRGKMEKKVWIDADNIIILVGKAEGLPGQ